MVFKFVSFAALFVVARAGILPAAPALSYAAPALSYAAPAPALSYAAAPAISYAAAAPALSYAAAPALSYAAHAPVAYAAPAPVAYAAPIAKAVIAEPSAPANYDFAYGVSDPHTGDQKSQQESRRGDVVQGSYSLVDSDGTRRVVDYSADGLNGFNAVVRKEPLAVKAIAAAAPVISSYAAPAPVLSSYAAASPVISSYAAAPIQSVGYSSLGLGSGLGYGVGLGSKYI